MNPDKKKINSLGMRRFPSGAEFQKQLQERARICTRRMVGNLADNYPATEYSRMASLYRSFAEERERALKSAYDISDDKFFVDTRPEYLYQILGDLLFLRDKAAGLHYTDKTYQDFLLKVKKAYLGRCTNTNLEESLSEIIGMPVYIRELYLEARKSGSAYTIKDTNRMVIDIYMDMADTETQIFIGSIIQDLYFFIRLFKPAHALFDTRLIWEEEISTTGCGFSGFASDENGNAFEYVYEDLPNTVYSLTKLDVFDGDIADSEIIQDNWIQGEISELDEDVKVITLVGGTELVVSNLSLLYKNASDGEHRIDFNELTVGDTVWFTGYEAPGSFTFHVTPEEITANWYKQFDPLFIQKPVFQDFVIKVKDDSGFDKSFSTCADGEEGLNLVEKDLLLFPMYEDMRDNCDYPSPKLFHDNFAIPAAQEAGSGDQYQDLPGSGEVTETSLVYTLSKSPIVGATGDLAGIDDLTVYVNGIRTLDGVASVDPLLGIVTLNFLPPAGSTLRIDFYYQETYPVLVSEDITRSPSAPGGGGPGDLGGSVTITNGIAVYFRWPFPPTEADADAFGDASSYQVEQFPILDRLGNLLADKEDVTVYVDGVEITDGIDFIRPLLGHIQLNFIPPAGSTVTFEYYYQSRYREYPMVRDSLQHLRDNLGAYNYTTLRDALPFNGVNTPIKGADKTPAEIGYRYRAFDLAASSVWNSKDTFILNDYERYGTKASFATSQSKFNRFALQFSTEYLEDDSKYIILDDMYLHNGLEPLLKLRKGIPPFFRSFTSWARYIYKTLIEPTESTTSTSIEGASDLAASAEVSGVPSGLIEFVPITEYFSEDRVKTLAGLYEVSTVEGNLDMDLSSICESSGFTLETKIEEEYYPNRELRLNDYKDYVERLFDNPVTGSLLAIKGSNLIKVVGSLWTQVRTGSVMTIDGNEYTVMRILNPYTIRLHRGFLSDSGEYTYSLVRSYVDHVDVKLNEVVRRKVVDMQNLMPFYSGFSGSSGYTPWLVEVSFPDPDPDPYPRNNGTWFSGNPGEGPAPGSPPLLDSEINDQGSEAYHLLSTEEADKMVKYRNWDQDLFIIAPELIEEPFTESLDDDANSILVLYWNVATQSYEEYAYRGMVLMTSESLGTVLASSYPNAIIRLENLDDDTGLNDTYYELKKTIVRQVLPDNTVDILVIDEFVRIP